MGTTGSRGTAGSVGQDRNRDTVVTEGAGRASHPRGPWIMWSPYDPEPMAMAAVRTRSVTTSGSRPGMLP